MTPTKEQQEALALFSSGHSLKLNAFAGTGKTASLLLFADSTSRSGIYLAFNRSIASEARSKFPRNVHVSTSHALAFRAIREQGYSQEQMTGQLNAPAILSILGLEGFQARKFSLTKINVATCVRKTMQVFCGSADRQAEPHHVPLEGVLGSLDGGELREFKAYIVKATRDLWEQVIDPSVENVFLGHDGYFKLWSLSRPVLSFSFIFVDEAQDTNDALLSVLTSQQTQVVYVGDRYQQIYAWRGATNAMEKIETPREASLTQSFRFGPAIADAASSVLRTLEPSVSIQGNTSVASILSTEDPLAILVRRNADLMQAVLQARDNCQSFHVVGGTRELVTLLEDVTRLRVGRRAQHSEFYGFSDWGHVLTFNQEVTHNPLRTFIGLVEQFGEALLLEAMEEDVDDMEIADIVLSTVHKAKGLEFDRVKIDEGFTDLTDEIALYEPEAVPEGLAEEIRLLYVAMTRARLEVGLPQWCHSFLRSKYKKEADVRPKAKARLCTAPQETLDIMERFAVIDFETTGLSPNAGDRAIEIGIALVEGDQIVETFDSLMNSGVRVDSFIEELTGISQKMVDRAPPAESVMAKAHEFVGDAQLVAHNASFDKRFWEREVRRATGKTPSQDFICTMLLSRRLNQNLPDHKLDTVTRHLKIHNQQHHRALGDAEATALVLIKTITHCRETFRLSGRAASALKKIQKTPKDKVVVLSFDGELEAAQSPNNPRIGTGRPSELFRTPSHITIEGPEQIFYKNGTHRSYKVTVEHENLGTTKSITAPDTDLLEQKIQKQIAVFDKKWEAEKKRGARQDERDELLALEDQATETVKSASANLEALRSTLVHTLSIDDTINWDDLREMRSFSASEKGTSGIDYDRTDGRPIGFKILEFDQEKPQQSQIPEPPRLEQFEKKPTLWQTITGQKKKLQQAAQVEHGIAEEEWIDARQELIQSYECEVSRWEREKADVERDNETLREQLNQEVEDWLQEQSAYNQRVSRANAQVDQLQKSYQNCEPSAVEEYCQLVLGNSSYPDAFPQNFIVSYESSQKCVSIDYQLPSMDAMDFLESVSVVKRARELKEKYLSKTQQKSLYTDVVFQVLLRTVHELFEADVANALTHISVNGLVDTVDEALGHDTTRCIAAIRCEKQAFLEIDLGRIVPEKCFLHLEGRGTPQSIPRHEAVEPFQTEEGVGAL